MSPRAVTWAVKRLAEIAEVRPQLVKRGTGDLSQRQAVKELNTSRRTVRRSIEDRAELCGL
ncbi:hypothetical protein [Haloglomus irregulare]|jgi:hypothetical protein|uniref:hypothetical protein n=1 Tax=Haloglomus irregulare TaxID=2234134 RepID=UPI00118503FE|nr:hypothetical protein [Haloglomus irregulare]